MAFGNQTAQSCVEMVSRVIHASRMARTARACHLGTRDREHALQLVERAATASDCPLFHYTVAFKRRYNQDHQNWEPIGGNGLAPMGLLQEAKELKHGGVIVLEDCLNFLRDESGDPQARMNVADIITNRTFANGLVLVFLGAPESIDMLPAILADLFVKIVVPFPKRAELEVIASEELAKAIHTTQTTVKVEEIKQQAIRLSTGLVGLTQSGAKDAIRDALAINPHDFNDAHKQLQERKNQQLSRELAMNVLDSQNVELPIGLDNMIRFLDVNRKKIILTGPNRSRGILAVGPPGTGKTMLARAIGCYLNIPVVELKISALMNSYLGETERLFHRAFATLEAMSPNVVFIDEIEKVLGDSSERDGGTMRRCNGALLSWLSDNLNPNFIIATSNNLARMGEIGMTMTRSERFDSIFFVDVPSFESRTEMLRRWLEGKMKNHAVTARKIAEITEKYSGADLRSIVKQAGAKAEFEGKALTLSCVIAEVERIRMKVEALYDQFQPHRSWGRMYCEPAGPMDT